MPIYERGTCNKLIFHTKHQAKRKQKLIRRRCGQVSNNVKMRSYYCDKCNGWHLTRMPLEVFISMQNEKANDGNNC